MVTADRRSIREILADALRRLTSGPHPEKARRDAEVLLLLALQREMRNATIAWLISHEEDFISPETEAEFKAFVERRSVGEPTQYIAGEAEFYGLPFRVNREVLIPRPETEHLVEKTIELAQGFARPRMVDVGAGSGAIAVTLACKLAGAHIAATEISSGALAVARENAGLNGVRDRVRFVEGDLLAPVAGEQFEIVVSNPPYVPERDRASLSVEVRDYEPAQALFAGEDGLEVYRRLIPAAFSVLVPGGFIALEIGYGQSDEVRELLAESGFAEIEFAVDLQGIPRVASAQRS
jgi:release factor glutamine methyltransferase